MVMVGEYGDDQPQTVRRRISVFGSTGSIGVNTLDLIGRNKSEYEVVALTANSNVEELARQAREFGAEMAVIADETRFDDLKQALEGSGIEAAAGSSGMTDAAQRPVDWVMAAIVGAAGLEPTLKAAEQGCHIGLANKECLVSAGDLFMDAVEKAGATLLPVDSEHSAVFQVFDAQAIDRIERIILTASGGPFRDWPLERLEKATREEALDHPNWDMGAKITVDSATMMNKGLELIEAYYLFPVGADKLDVLVHPQSIIHSMVEYSDGSVLAQMGMPDMRTPIAYALAWPGRMKAPAPRLDLAQIGSLTFEAPDVTRFPAIRLAREALNRGNGAPSVLNGANEAAVAAFIKNKITYLNIARLVEDSLNKAEQRQVLVKPQNLDDVMELDGFGRRAVEEKLANE